MSPSTSLRRGCVLLLAAGVLLGVPADKVSEGRSETIQEFRAAFRDLVGEGRSYLGSLAGEQTVVSVQKAFSQVLIVLAGGLAGGLNVLLQHISNLLEVAGVQVGVSAIKATPEGVVFVIQWLLVALVGYWLISLALRLLAATLKRTLWLLKVALATVCFALILSDYRVGTEAMALRLGVLVCVCVLLGVGAPGSAAASQTARLEQQVKVLEKRMRDMERWTKTDG